MQLFYPAARLHMCAKRFYFVRTLQPRDEWCVSLCTTAAAGWTVPSRSSSRCRPERLADVPQYVGQRQHEHEHWRHARLPPAGRVVCATGEADDQCPMSIKTFNKPADAQSIVSLYSGHLITSNNLHTTFARTPGVHTKRSSASHLSFWTLEVSEGLEVELCTSNSEVSLI